MTDGTSSKTLIERFIRACNECDGRSAWSMLAPSITVTVAGSTWFSGRFDGEEQIRRILLATVADYLGDLNIHALELIGEDGAIAALLEVSGCTRDGHAFSRAGSAWGACFCVTDAAITTIELFPDTMWLETAVSGAQFRPNDPTRNPL